MAGKTKGGGKSPKKKKSPGKSPGKKEKGRGRSKSPRKKARGRKSPEEPSQEPQEEVQEKKDVPEPPPGVVPLFFTTQTQQIFNILVDVNVSRESPNTILDKNAILEDINHRKAFSDFSSIRDMIEMYPAKDMLVVYDADFIYGENFFVCVTAEAKENILCPPEEEDEEDDPFALPDIPYIPPEPKPWQCLGSDVEVISEKVFESRAKVQLSITKPRRHFGRKYLFSNRDADAGKDTYQECLPNYERRNIVYRKELDKGIQAVPKQEARPVQTDYLKPLKQWSQYEARELSEEDKGDVMESEKMGGFLKAVTPIMESLLQQNEIIDVFRNDWMKLNPGKSLMTERHETYLKEYQSFQDLHYSKDKQIICDDWHTTIPGLVGVSCVEQMSFDVRLRNMSRIMLVPSLVLLWNYQDPIHPRLLLESHDDCFTFRFNPVNPNIVVGGCMSGRIVLWDLTEYYGMLSMTESAIRMKKLDFLSSLVEDTEGKIPVVQPVATSNIDFGHSSCVTDLQWLMPPYVIDRQGKILEEASNAGEECHQIISCAGDDHFFIWDIVVHSHRRGAVGPTPDVGAAGVNRWQLLDHNWRPVARLGLPMRADGTPYSLCQFCVWYRTKQTKPDADEEEGGDEESEEQQPQTSEATDDAARCPLSIYAGTQAGEILFMEMKIRLDSDTKRNLLYEIAEQQVHADPIRSICISSFFEDMVLTVGGFRFAVWKVGVKGEPLMVSAESPARRTSGAWSLTRPSVFFIGRQDGMIEVWDMLDRSQQPLLTQSLSGVEVTSLNLRKLGRRQVLSVSDNSGNLHLLEVPHLLTQIEGDELQMLENLFAREALRQEDKLKRDMEMEEQMKEDAKKESSPSRAALPAQAQDPTPVDAERTAEMEHEDMSVYEAYQTLERGILDKLHGREPSKVVVMTSATKAEL